MTTHILQLIEEMKMKKMKEEAWRIDEKAQIVVHIPRVETIIFRFRSLKAAEKAYKALDKARATVYSNPSGDHFHEVVSDVFRSTLHVPSIASVTLVDVEEFNSFRMWGSQPPQPQQ